MELSILFLAWVSGRCMTFFQILNSSLVFFFFKHQAGVVVWTNFCDSFLAIKYDLKCVNRRSQCLWPTLQSAAKNLEAFITS